MLQSGRYPPAPEARAVASLIPPCRSLRPVFCRRGLIRTGLAQGILISALTRRWHPPPARLSLYPQALFCLRSAPFGPLRVRNIHHLRANLTNQLHFLQALLLLLLVNIGLMLPFACSASRLRSATSCFWFSYRG